MLNLATNIERMKQHIAADELVRGVGFENGKGCFVGCTFDYYDHARAAKESGVPEWLWFICDKLHEGMSDSVDRGDMSVRLLTGFQHVNNFEHLRHNINLFILRRNLDRVEAMELADAIKAQVIKAVDLCIACHAESLLGVIEPARWSAAESAAWSAARSARSAAESAAESAESAAVAVEYDAIGTELLRLLEAV